MRCVVLHGTLGVPQHAHLAAWHARRPGHHAAARNTPPRDTARFGFFCGAAAEYLRVRDVKPDVLHCHDWQTAPVAWGERPNGATCVFTIHNLNYGADLVGRAMGTAEVATTVSPTYAREVWRAVLLVWCGGCWVQLHGRHVSCVPRCVCAASAGAAHLLAPLPLPPPPHTHTRPQISGHPVIAPHLNKMFGIRNGIDQVRARGCVARGRCALCGWRGACNPAAQPPRPTTLHLRPHARNTHRAAQELWDPASDEYIPSQYGPEDVLRGEARAALTAAGAAGAALDGAHQQHQQQQQQHVCMCACAHVRMCACAHVRLRRHWLRALLLVRCHTCCSCADQHAAHITAHAMHQPTQARPRRALSCGGVAISPTSTCRS
jgi:hypothetical protein